MPQIPLADPPAIIVTASRSAEEAGDTPASVTLVEEKRIERLGLPQVADYLRLVPSAAVAVSGPAGSQAQLRIRGAEANHTLLFVEGIRANDPAAGNEPRFELLNADSASRIEIVRGPQSALWGSEAIGGVVSVTGAEPGSGGTQAFAETGSHQGLRAAARGSAGDPDRGLSIGAAFQRSDGIDSFSGEGDKDGYRNAALRGAGRYRVSPGLLLGASGFALWGNSEFDGFDPVTFLHADTLDESRNRLAAGRLYGEYGDREQLYALASASLLGSTNRNSLAGDPVNRTSATRRNLSLEAGGSFGRHRIIGAVEGEREEFEARDTGFGGFTRQDRSRRHQSLTLEWRMADLGPLSAGLAARHDIFSRFKDATTFRASAKIDVGSGVSFSTNYGEGIAQPSFFDLYGFFPGSFAGNPGLKPESSRGGEVSLRYATGRASAALTYYRQRLKDEIVDLFDPETFLSTTANASGKSKRQGLEAEASFAPTPALRLTATYAYLDADEPAPLTEGQLKETRRPRHSGSLALDGTSQRFSYGAAIAYTGDRIDTDFDRYPAERVTLDSYWLASGRVAYRVRGPIEAHLRIANAFGERYEDVVGYRTEGRSIHAGLRVALGR